MSGESAAERLGAAFLSGVPEETWVGAYPFLHIDGALVQNILAADPRLAQDIEDGRALRELREADDVIEPHDIEVSEDPDDAASVRFMVRVLDTDAYGMGSTIAAAADKAREALR